MIKCNLPPVEVKPANTSPSRRSAALNPQRTKGPGVCILVPRRGHQHPSRASPLLRTTHHRCGGGNCCRGSYCSLYCSSPKPLTTLPVSPSRVGGEGGGGELQFSACSRHFAAFA
ncbi:hypothetical protein AMECASPLE_003189 [Ameca splendens]|uniref:Uncharacterized protein n=1 Tax=Ameca splendens TaxID=208324 RepID=A0ABV0YWJ2_9TELE